MHKSPYTQAWITILIWGFGIYLTRLISIRSEFLLIMLTFFFAMWVLWLYLSYMAKRNETDLLSKFKWKYCFWGALGYFAYSVPLIQGFRAYGSASETLILSYTWPIFSVFFSKLFDWGTHQKSFVTKIIEILALCLGFIAVVLIMTEGSLFHLQIINSAGLVWGMIAGISYGLFTSYSANVPENEHPIFLIAGLVTSLILVTPLGLAEWAELQKVTYMDIGLAALSGCVGDGLAYITWTGAIRLATNEGISISKIVTLIYLLPPFQLIVIAVFFNENHLTQAFFVWGLILITISSVLAQQPEKVMHLINYVFKNRAVPASHRRDEQ